MIADRSAAAPVVGIAPAAAAYGRPRLLGALSRLLNVRFVPVCPGPPARGLSGQIVFCSPEDAADRRWRSQVPTLILNGEGRSAQRASISFNQTVGVDPRLRGAVLSGEWSPGGCRDLDPGSVLATVGTQPAWARLRWAQTLEIVSVDAPELADDECLRDRITPGRCLAMIALLQFLRALGPPTWSPPVSRATFIVDDPNLRWPTYGHVNFADVLAHAVRWHYHVSFATIPLDLRVFDRRVTRLFRQSARHLSLTMHGNNHTRRELASPVSLVEADRLLAQALRRTTRFEMKTGIRVGRVMVPPHEACSQPVLAELPKLGFEAVTLNRAYAWMSDHEPSSPYVGSDDSIAGFGPTELTEVGTPVLIRRAFAEHQEVVLRGFLDQPIVMYGHASDFSDGLGFLEAASSAVNHLPNVVWSDVSGVSRSCYLAHRRGDVLHVRPFARRIDVALEAGVRAVVVEPIVHGTPRPDQHLTYLGNRACGVSEAARSVIAVPPADHDATIAIKLIPASPVAVSAVSGRPRSRYAVLRRAATEARDRSQPLLSRRRAAS